MSPRRRGGKAAGGRELSVYDGHELVGTIEVGEDDEARAFDQYGKLLGSFASVKFAFTAFDTIVERGAATALIEPRGGSSE
jgi:hypothetical protein